MNLRNAFSDPNSINEEMKKRYFYWKNKAEAECDTNFSPKMDTNLMLKIRGIYIGNNSCSILTAFWMFLGSRTTNISSYLNNLSENLHPISKSLKVLTFSDPIFISKELLALGTAMFACTKDGVSLTFFLTEVKRQP